MECAILTHNYRRRRTRIHFPLELCLCVANHVVISFKHLHHPPPIMKHKQLNGFPQSGTMRSHSLALSSWRPAARLLKVRNQNHYWGIQLFTTDDWRWVRSCQSEDSSNIIRIVSIFPSTHCCLASTTLNIKDYRKAVIKNCSEYARNHTRCSWLLRVNRNLRTGAHTQQCTVHGVHGYGILEVEGFATTATRYLTPERHQVERKVFYSASHAIPTAHRRQAAGTTSNYNIVCSVIIAY